MGSFRRVHMPRGMAACRATVLGLLLAAACAPGDPPQGHFADRSAAADLGEAADGAAASDLADAEGPQPGALSPDGTWLFWSETVSCVQVSTLRLEGLTERLALVELEDLGGGLLRSRQRTCQIQQTPVLGQTTVIPDRVAESIPEQRFVALLSGNEAGATFLNEGAVELWGAQLSDPEHEDLPTSPDDPRVYDMDGDGKPGATLVLGNNVCEMHVVQRGSSRWLGRIVSPIRIEGGGTSTSVQNLLQATGPFCAMSYQVEYIDDRHRFALLRADGRHGAPDLDADGDGTITCAEVRAFGCSTFEPETPDNSRCAETPN